MLLSDKTTAATIDENFVATWKEVRPVPKVTIDFGNGKKMERTLVGNTVMYVSLPDGTVVDAFPGVYTPGDFNRLVVPALKAAKDAMALLPGKRAKFLAKWHKAELDQLLSNELTRTTTSKAFVESPLLDSIGMVALQPTTLSKSGVEAPILKASRLEARTPEVKQTTSRSAFDTYASRIEDVSKKPASIDQLKARLRLPKDADPKTLAARVLDMDSNVNVTRVHPAVHILLSEPEKKTADDLCAPLYKQLLHVDIDDPYLGLRDFSMPGTPDH